MTDLVQRLRDSVTQARAVDRAALLAEAANEIEQLLVERSNWRTCFENERALHDEILRQAREMAGLRGRPEPSDIVTRLRQTRANMLGTDDEAHYWDCHEAADEIERRTLSEDEREALVWFTGGSGPVCPRYLAILREMQRRLARERQGSGAANYEHRQHAGRG